MRTAAYRLSRGEKTDSKIVPTKFSNRKSWIMVLFVLDVLGRGPI